MLVELVDELSLHLLSVHLLPEEVSVKDGRLAAEDIWLALEVVVLQMAEEFRSHVRVVWARPHRWEEMRAGVLVGRASDDPAWENDCHEVASQQEPALSAVLDVDRVQMHVVLWANIGVKSGVNVLEVDAAGVLVLGVR